MIHFKPSKCGDVCVRLTKVVKVVKEMSNVKCQHIVTNLSVREQKNGRAGLSVHVCVSGVKHNNGLKCMMAVHE